MMKWHDNNGGGDNDDDDNNKDHDNNGGGDNDESDNDKDDISTTLIEEDVDDDDVGEESDTKDYNKMFMNWTISKYYQVLEFCVWVWLHAFFVTYMKCLLGHVTMFV